MTLAGVAIIGTTVAVWFLGFEIPRTVRLGGLAYGVALLLVGRPTSSKAKELLWQERMIYAVDCGGDPDDGDVFDDGGIYEEPLTKFQEWDIEHKGDWQTPNLVFFESIDYENKTAVGTWTGTLSGRQLMLGLQEVIKLREEHEEDVRRAQTLESNLWIIVKRAATATVRRVKKTFARGTLPDAEVVGREVDQVLADFGARRAEIEDLDDDAPANEIPGIELQVPDLDDLSTSGRDTGGGDE